MGTGATNAIRASTFSTGLSHGRKGFQRPIRSDHESGGLMPLVTLLNLRREDRLSDLEEAIKQALTSMPELAIKADEIDLVPLFRPEDFNGEVTRINIDMWERTEGTKEALQELATRVARAFQTIAGADRRVKVVIRPYDVERSGWVSL